MDTRTPQPGETESESSRPTGVSCNTSLIGTQHQRIHQLVHRDAANAATKIMTQDAYLKIVHMTASSKNTKQHAIGCEYIDTIVNGRQLTI